MLGLLAPLASVLGLEAGDIVRRMRQNALLWGAIALFSAIALTFLLVALNAALTEWLGPIWAPIAIAGGAALIALALYAGALLTARLAHKREAQRRQSAERTALVTTATLTALPILLKSPLMRTVGLPVGGALAALYFLMRPSSGTSSDEEKG